MVVVIIMVAVMVVMMVTVVVSMMVVMTVPVCSTEAARDLVDNSTVLQNLAGQHFYN